MDNITAIYCYAAIELGKKRFNFLGNTEGKPKQFEFSEVKGIGVKVKNHLDTLVIPYANLAAIRIKEEAAEIKEPRNVIDTSKSLERGSKFKLNEK